MKTIVPEAVVVVGYKGKTCNGIRGNTAQSSVSGEEGDKGVISGSVKVDLSEIEIPVRGDTVMVGGKTAFVSEARFDACQAIMTISYTETRPHAAEGAP